MKPRVFISSTFYDLKQVRASITSALISLQFEVLNSTEPSFFADPSRNKVENCETNVRSCDILVLIIGGRYGGVLTTDGHSITNLEYLWARQHGIPIFTFVERDVWVLYQHWLDNKRRTAARKGSRIDVRVFPFIEDVSEAAKSDWIWSFDAVSEIELVLRNQFASLVLLQVESLRKGAGNIAAISRERLMAQYSPLISKSNSRIDIIGVSLITISRSPGIDKAFANLSPKTSIRVLLLDPASDGARLRAAEEYGSPNLIAELDASTAIWNLLRKSNPRIEIRKYSRFPRLFYFRVDSKAFVAFYPINESSVNVPTFEIIEPFVIDQMNQLYFEPLWLESTPA